MPLNTNQLITKALDDLNVLGQQFVLDPCKLHENPFSGGVAYTEDLPAGKVYAVGGAGAEYTWSTYEDQLGEVLSACQRAIKNVRLPYYAGLCPFYH